MNLSRPSFERIPTPGKVFFPVMINGFLKPGMLMRPEWDREKFIAEMLFFYGYHYADFIY